MSKFRDRCLEAGRDAMGRNDGWRWWAPRHLGKLFDLWEPMIRSNERDLVEDSYEDWISPERQIEMEAIIRDEERRNIHIAIFEACELKDE